SSSNRSSALASWRLRLRDHRGGKPARPSSAATTGGGEAGEGQQREAAWRRSEGYAGETLGRDQGPPGGRLSARLGVDLEPGRLGSDLEKASIIVHEISAPEDHAPGHGGEAEGRGALTEKDARHAVAR